MLSRSASDLEAAKESRVDWGAFVPTVGAKLIATALIIIVDPRRRR